jgi:hypothetical protein
MVVLERYLLPLTEKMMRHFKNDPYCHLWTVKVFILQYRTGEVRA